MAADMGDAAFAAECRKIADGGRESIKRLFDRENFINLIDAKHPEALALARDVTLRAKESVNSRLEFA